VYCGNPFTTFPEDPVPVSSPLGAPPYRALLDVAYRIGEADGALACLLQLPEQPPAVQECFHGRDASQFAQWLWHPRPEPPPSGLIANAGLWYLAGFRDGVEGSRTGILFTGDLGTATAGVEECPKTARLPLPDRFAVSHTHKSGRPAVRQPRAAKPPSSVRPRAATAVDRSHPDDGPPC
jgi:hypothetical protein